MTRRELQDTMDEALKAAHSHIVTMTKLRETASNTGQAWDEATFRKVRAEQEHWEREMQKYNAAATALMSLNNINCD